MLATRPPRVANKFMTWINAGRRADLYARELYVNLRMLDKSGAREILVEEVPGGELWEAVRDRLRRAASAENVVAVDPDIAALRADMGEGRGTHERPRGRAPGAAAVGHVECRHTRAGRGYGTPLLIVDSAVVRRQYLALSRALPGVGLYYALKPLPIPTVVAELKDLGACFDIATTGELRLVRGRECRRERCMHTHPIKRHGEIAAALRYGIRRFVVDNPDELRKFTPHRKRAELLLRVSFRNPAAMVDLSRKFGCEPGAVPSLLDMRGGPRADRSRPVLPRGLAGSRPEQVRRGHRRLPRADRPRRGARRYAGLDDARHRRRLPGCLRGDELPSIREFCAPVRKALRSLPQSTCA